MSGRIVALLAWVVLAGSTLPAPAQKDDKAEKYPAPPEGFDKKRRRHRPRQAGDGRVRLDDGRRQAQGAGLHAAGLHQGQEVPGAVPAARHRRRRERVAARRRARRDPRQPVRRQEGRADDRRHAQRPGVEGRDGASPGSAKQGPAFAAFEKDLLTDLIPFVEKTYSVKADRESRALAGLSMGGGQSLNFGLGNLDTFAWVGGFSSAPNTKPPADLIKDHAEAAKKLRLLYVACGDKDGLFRISEGVHKMLDEKKVPHVYRVIPGGAARLQGVEERPVPLRPTDLPRAGAGEASARQEGRRRTAGEEGRGQGRRRTEARAGGGLQAGVLQPARQAVPAGEFRRPRPVPHRRPAGPERAGARVGRDHVDEGRGRRLGRHHPPPGRGLPLLPDQHRRGRRPGPRQQVLLRRRPLGQRHRNPRQGRGLLRRQERPARPAPRDPVLLQEHRPDPPLLRLHAARLRQGHRASATRCCTCSTAAGEDETGWGEPGAREPDHGQPDRRGEGQAVHHRDGERRRDRPAARRSARRRAARAGPRSSTSPPSRRS